MKNSARLSDSLCHGEKPRWQVQARLATLVVTLVLCLSSSARAGDAAAARILVDATKVEGEISPLLYGQFDEFMFQGVKGGVSAELVRDRSFDGAPNSIGLPRYWERDPDDRNDDPGVHFHWDDTVFFPQKRTFQADVLDHSLRVDLGLKDGQRRGLRQSGLPIRKGMRYQGYLWAKAENYDGFITIALEADRTGGASYASTEIHGISGDWRRYEFTLTSSADDPLAKLAVLFYGKGRLWLDQISLVPGDAVHGIRGDVFQKLKSLAPAYIRWPGGNVAQDYHWLWGVGPKDERPAWVNLSWANELESGDLGTGEFVQLCRDLGAEPSLTVNVEGRGATAEEAANWVEYANGPVTSKYGAMRAVDGHVEPYRVKYWEIGNEIWGDWVRGHSDAATYARNLSHYAAAMRAVDPSIRLIGVGDNDMNWNRAVLMTAGSTLDYLAIHHYYGEQDMHGDLLNLMAHPLHYQRLYRELAQTIGELVPDHPILLAINEWNTSLPLPAQHCMLSALYGARLMNVLERSSIVGMSAPSDMVNGWSGGLIQASRHGVFVTPTYLVNQLYANHLGRYRLSSTVESPTFDSTREGTAVPYLDVVVSRSADGRQIFIKTVNTNFMQSLHTAIRIAGAKPHARARMETVNGPSLTAASSFAAPDAVAVRTSSVEAGENFTVDLPEHSVSVITLEVD
jgi:alpha-N-arabinofuranosidase